MKKLLAFLILAIPIGAQQVNPNQIRPSNTNGQIISTTGCPGACATSWQNQGGTVQLTGDVTGGPSASPVSTTVVKVNGASIPNAGFLGGNGSGQLINAGSITAGYYPCGTATNMLGSCKIDFGVTLGDTLTIAATNTGGTQLSLISNGPTTIHATNGLIRLQGDNGDLIGLGHTFQMQSGDPTIQFTLLMKCGGSAGTTATGYIGFQMPTSCTAYNLIWPSAQWTGPLENDGTGNLSGVPQYSAAGTPAPTCTSGLKGMQAYALDATAPTYLGIYLSGGTVFAPIVCNGTTWVTY